MDRASKKRKNHVLSSDDMMAMINIVLAIIWAVVICQRFCKGFGFWANLGIGLVFVTIYMIVSMKPFVSLIPNIASTIMYVGMLWAVVDLIGNDVARIIVKVIVVAFVGLLEFLLFTNPTLKVLTKKMEKPKVVNKDGVNYLVSK